MRQEGYYWIKRLDRHDRTIEISLYCNGEWTVDGDFTGDDLPREDHQVEVLSSRLVPPEVT